MSTVTGYLSGVSPSLLAFIVFGTTKTFQHKMYQTFIPQAIRKKLSGHKHSDLDDGFTCRNAEGSLPFSSAAWSSFARASTIVVTGPPHPPPDTKSIGSTSAPTTPCTPRRGSLRPPERTSFLSPIREPFQNRRGSAAAVDDVEAQGLRRSQIGVAVSGSPEPQSPRPVLHKSRGRRATFGTIGTFFRDDSVEDLQQQIPLSRFNMRKHNTHNDDGYGAGQVHTSNMHFPGRTDSFASTTTTTTIWSEARPLSGDNRALGRTRFGSVS